MPVCGHKLNDFVHHSCSLCLQPLLQLSIVGQTMTSSFNLPSVQGTLLHKSHFLGQAFLHKPFLTLPKKQQSFCVTAAKFNLYEILGGRGICGGEEGLQEELKKTAVQESTAEATENHEKQALSAAESLPEDAFEKELLGLTGGFPGGEIGLQKFIEKNPPPKKSPTDQLAAVGFDITSAKKPKPPDLPLLLPGMIAIVKNPKSPYYMYCGIVQRITDGRAGVLLEGGVWDRLITFRLEELERREKGPPMVNPRSVILETMTEQGS